MSLEEIDLVNKSQTNTKLSQKPQSPFPTPYPCWNEMARLSLRRWSITHTTPHDTKWRRIESIFIYKTKAK